MDDVYLLNNPFTFQSMEKHSAYCAMMRLGLKVPDTWLVPAQAAAVERALPDDGGALQPRVRPERRSASYVGFPLYLKPFDGGQWRGVSRAREPGGAAPPLRRVGRAADARAVGGRRLRRLRAQPVDRRRDDGDVVRPRQADVRPLPGEARLPDRRPGLRGRDDLEGRQRVLPLGVQLVRVDRARGRGVPDRLRERVARRRADEPALLLPVGDHRARALVRVLRRGAAAHAHRRRHAPVVRDRATATTSPTRRSCASTAGSPTSTSRPTRTPSSARGRSRTWTRRRTSGSRATSSTACSWPRCARRSPRTSTSGSSSTTVACWPRGPATVRRVRHPAGRSRGRDRAGTPGGPAGGADAVDEVGEALRQRRGDLIRLSLGELAGRHVAGDLRLLCRNERGDETVGRLAARGRSRPVRASCRPASCVTRLAGVDAEIRGRSGEVVSAPAGAVTEAAGSGRTACGPSAVDEVGEALRQRRRDLVRLSLGQRCPR